MPLTGLRLSKSLPQERLALVAQLSVRALGLPEELGQFLVTRLLGVLEVGRARFHTLEGMIEHADDIVMLISGAGRAFARGHIPPFQRHGGVIGSSATQPRWY
jgi:hypothetical protein